MWDTYIDVSFISRRLQNVLKAHISWAFSLWLQTPCEFLRVAKRNKNPAFVTELFSASLFLVLPRVFNVLRRSQEGWNTKRIEFWSFRLLPENWELTNAKCGGCKKKADANWGSELLLADIFDRFRTNMGPFLSITPCKLASMKRCASQDENCQSLSLVFSININRYKRTVIFSHHWHQLLFIFCPFSITVCWRAD